MAALDKILILTLGKASVHTGLADWAGPGDHGGMQDLPVFWLVALIRLFTVLIHLPLPIAQVVNAVLIPPVATLALTMGINPVLVVLPVAFLLRWMPYRYLPTRKAISGCSICCFQGRSSASFG